MKKWCFVCLFLGLVYAKSQTDDAIQITSASARPVNYRWLNYSQPSDFSSPFAALWNTEQHFHRVEVNSGFEGNSNAIHQQFVWSLLFNSGFNAREKDKIRNGLKWQNAYEDFSSTGIRYKYHSEKFDGFFTAGYHFRTNRIGFFYKQVYELLLYGNAMFENQTVNLSETRFENSVYQQFSLGFLKNIREKHFTITFGLNASFLHGLNNQRLFITRGKLFTAEDGEYLDVVYQLRFDQHRGGNVRKREKADVGMSADFLYRMTFRKKFAFSFSILDFGVINWRAQPLNYYGGRDSVRFRGIEFNDLANLPNTDFGSIKIDSILKNFLPNKRSDKYQTFLPFILNLTLSKAFWRDRVVVHAGIQYKPLYRYFVYGFVKANYFVKPDILTSLTLGYGGYSKLNIGLEAAKHWSRFELAAGTNNFIGTVSPANYPGASAYIRMGVNF